MWMDWTISQWDTALVVQATILGIIAILKFSWRDNEKDVLHIQKQISSLILEACFFFFMARHGSAIMLLSMHGKKQWKGILGNFSVK